MRKIIFILLFAIPTLSVFSQKKENNETTTFYFIRHAEKDRTNKEDQNPSLTQDGLSRALKWAEVFKNIKFNAVYSTPYNRTQQTASPTAYKNNVEVITYDPRNFDLNHLKNTLKGKTVLIVGHSNTTPAMVNTLLDTKKYTQIDDTNNGNLYIVTINDCLVTSNLLYIN